MSQLQQEAGCVKDTRKMWKLSAQRKEHLFSTGMSREGYRGRSI